MAGSSCMRDAVWREDSPCRRAVAAHTLLPCRGPCAAHQGPPPPVAAASPLEKEYAHQQAAVVNAAYDVLKKPLRRAHYIVRLCLW